MEYLAHLPLTETTFYILLSLAPEPKHGYAIIKDVQRLSSGRVVLSTGTLFGAIKRLLEQGWIERCADYPAQDDRRERKAYRLTETGRRILSAEISRLDQLVKTAHLRTGPVPGEP